MTKSDVPTPVKPADATHAEHVSALISLLALEGTDKSAGVPPSPEELALLADNTPDQQLNFQRRQEIYSHLNNHPQLMMSWLALVQAKADIKTSTQAVSLKPSFLQRCVHWLKNYTWQSATGLTAACVILSLLIWPGLYNTDIQQPVIATGSHPQPGYATLDHSLLKAALYAEIQKTVSALADNDKALFLAYNELTVLPHAADSASVNGLGNSDDFGRHLVSMHLSCARGQWAESQLKTYLQVEQAVQQRLAIKLNEEISPCTRSKNLMTILLP